MQERCTYFAEIATIFDTPNPSVMTSFKLSKRALGYNNQ
jgi:hypothetical protein